MHHECDEHADACEVCVIVNNFHSADIPDSQIHIAFLEYTYFSYAHFNATIPYKIQKGFYSTAPPSY